MARNPLQPGEIGTIRTVQIRPGLWRADASYCDRSGTKGRCRKSGRTEAAARRALADELEERVELENAHGLVTPTSLVNEAVDIYLANRMDDARNGIGRANPRSVKIYRSVAENWITPILGELQVRHLTAGRLDAYFRTDIPPGRYADVTQRSRPRSGRSSIAGRGGECARRVRRRPSRIIAGAVRNEE